MIVSRMAPALLIAACLILLARGAEAKVLISVDKSTQRMTVTLDGRPLYSWAVSTGRSRYGTPAGTFTPFRLEEDHYSKEWDEAPMPHSIFFTRTGHAIHGSLDVRRLGRPASHGCVRLAPANAARLFALVRSQRLERTRVVLTGVEPPSARTAAPARRPIDPRSRMDALPPELAEEYGEPYARPVRGWR